MSVHRVAFAAMAAMAVSACAIPRLNVDRQIEVEQIINTVECELYAVAQYFPNELDPNKPDTWDIASTLDLTLVRRIDADGKVAWAIPVNYSLTPSLGGYVQDTVTAHVEFTTDLAEVAKAKGPASECRMGPDYDPSGTGLGLAAWIQTTFNAVQKDSRGGLSYTKDFEVKANAGTRFGYVFAPVEVDVGASAQATKTNRLVVAVSPHAGPQRVVIVGDTRKSISISVSRRNRILNNPNLNMLLNRQAPVRLAPGTTLR